MVFRKLGITESIIKAIHEEKFEKPTEIQEKSIPLILEGKDVIAGSATGSGKTLIFGSAIIQSSEKGRGIQALVLTPTRELAEQITTELKKFSKYKHLEITAVYGGLSINPQISAIRTAEVIVGTPGRILDHLQRGTINLSRIKILVLDEADRMLDMGFLEDVERIISQCNRKRQTLLFSATISHEISRLARKYMSNPVEISAESYVDPKKLKQVFYDVQDNLKFSLLVHLLKHERSGLVMVFCNTQRNTDFVANNLRHSGIDATAIHGGFSQAKRNNIMKQFHSNEVHVLVCTDVAARGLDIKGVSHIYNYDTPAESKAYIHRIGRTARAGEEGIAISLISSRDYDNFSRVLGDNDIEIQKLEVPYVERVEVRFSPRRNFRRQGYGGRDRPYRSREYGRREERGSYGREDKDDRRYGERGDHKDRGDSRYGNRNRRDNRRFQRRY